MQQTVFQIFDKTFGVYLFTKGNDISLQRRDLVVTTYKEMKFRITSGGQWDIAHLLMWCNRKFLLHLYFCQKHFKHNLNIIEPLDWDSSLWEIQNTREKKVNDVTKTESDELWGIVQDNLFGL